MESPMSLESFDIIAVEICSAVLLAPAVKKLSLAAARGLSFLKRNQTPAISDSANSSTVHQALAEVDNLLFELQSTLHAQTTTPPAIQNHHTISQADHEITEMVDSIHDLVDEVRQIAGPITTTAENTQSQTRQAVGEVLDSILAFGGTKRRARIFMSTGTGIFDTSGAAYSLKIRGNLGAEQLTFASGTTQAQIITTINQFKSNTGVSAKQDNKTSQLIELQSARRGGRFFVAARKLSGNIDDIFYDESRSHPANLQVDFGEQ